MAAIFSKNKIAVNISTVLFWATIFYLFIFYCIALISILGPAFLIAAIANIDTPMEINNVLNSFSAYINEVSLQKEVSIFSVKYFIGFSIFQFSLYIYGVVLLILRRIWGEYVLIFFVLVTIANIIFLALLFHKPILSVSHAEVLLPNILLLFLLVGRCRKGRKGT